MNNRQNIFSSRYSKFYCLCPYIQIYKVQINQIFLFRADTGQRVLISILNTKNLEEFVTEFSMPISKSNILQKIKEWISSEDPEIVLNILIDNGVLEICG